MCLIFDQMFFFIIRDGLFLVLFIYSVIYLFFAGWAGEGWAITKTNICYTAKVVKGRTIFFFGVGGWVKGGLAIMEKNSCTREVGEKNIVDK